MSSQNGHAYSDDSDEYTDDADRSDIVSRLAADVPNAILEDANEGKITSDAAPRSVNEDDEDIEDWGTDQDEITQRLSALMLDFDAHDAAEVEKFADAETKFIDVRAVRNGELQPTLERLEELDDRWKNYKAMHASCKKKSSIKKTHSHTTSSSSSSRSSSSSSHHHHAGSSSSDDGEHSDKQTNVIVVQNKLNPAAAVAVLAAAARVQSSSAVSEGDTFGGTYADLDGTAAAPSRSMKKREKINFADTQDEELRVLNAITFRDGKEYPTHVKLTPTAQKEDNVQSAVETLIQTNAVNDAAVLPVVKQMHVRFAGDGSGFQVLPSKAPNLWSSGAWLAEKNASALLASVAHGVKNSRHPLHTARMTARACTTALHDIMFSACANNDEHLSKSVCSLTETVKRGVNRTHPSALEDTLDKVITAALQAKNTAHIQTALANDLVGASEHGDRVPHVNTHAHTGDRDRVMRAAANATAVLNMLLRSLNNAGENNECQLLLRSTSVYLNTLAAFSYEKPYVKTEIEVADKTAAPVADDEGAKNSTSSAMSRFADL